MIGETKIRLYWMIILISTWYRKQWRVSNNSLTLAMMHQFDVWNICLLERRWILSNRGSVLIHNYQTLLFFGEKRDCFSREGSTTFCAYWTSNQGDHDLLICVSQAIAHKREVNSRKKNNKACPISGNSTNNFSLKTIFKTKKPLYNIISHD